MVFTFGNCVSDYGAITRTLKRGDKGVDVKELQQILIQAGYQKDYSKSTRWSVTVDGDFGGNTEAAVWAFQGDHKLKQDGIVGPKTLDALRAWIEERRHSATPAVQAPPSEAKPIEERRHSATPAVQAPPSEAKPAEKKPIIQMEPIEIVGQVPKSSNWVLWGLGVGVLALALKGKG